MASRIITKKGSGAPTSGDLVHGELAVDTTNKRLYTENASGTVIEVGTNPTSLTTGTFTSTGIDDNATSTAITIDSNENVGIGTSSPSAGAVGGKVIHVQNSGGTASVRVDRSDAATSGTLSMTSGDGSNGLFSTGAKPLVFVVNSTERMRIDASGRVLLNRTASTGSLTLESQAPSGFSIGSGFYSGSTQSTIEFKDSNTTANYKVRIGSQTDDMVMFAGGSERMRIDSSGDIRLTGTAPSAEDNISTINFFNTSSSVNLASITGKRTAGGTNYGSLIFNTTSSGTIAERMRIDSSGNLLVGTTQADVGFWYNRFGFVVESGGQIHSAVSGDACAVFNRNTNDGEIVQLRQAGSLEGSISVSGSTVSYNGFAGRHESSGISSSTEKGTVVSTIDELDTYSSGAKQGQTRTDHAKVKVSDIVGDSCVYGVVDDFNDEGKVNVISVGIGAVRVTGSCAKGDLLESNGDGTARVQTDDIVRNKTIGKVTIGNNDANVKLVSCVLYCG